MQSGRRRTLRTAIVVATVLVFAAGSAYAATPVLVRTSAPRGGTAGALESVSFASASLGWAAGSTGVSLSGTGVDRLLLSWNGSQWRKVSLAAIASSDEALEGVVAVSPTEAWAVGGQNPYGKNPDLPVLLHYNGSTWASATGAFTTGRLWAVSASSATDVWAMGTQLERYDGHAWKLVSTPVLAKSTRVAISAASPTDAWIAGTQFSSTYSRRGQPLIEHWNGASWQVVTLPPTTTDDRLTSIAARSASDVWAVGFSSGVPLTMHWDGSSWQRINAASAAQNGAFESVAVDASGAVWAVGHEDGVDSRDYAVWRPLAQRWTGAVWQKVSGPVVGDFDAWLGGVAIVGGQVWAVGANQGTLVARSPTS
jgi:hypothetical protein